MENQFRHELDERLVNVLLHYVEERNMPLTTAKQILMYNLSERCLFDNYWLKFNTILNNKVCKAI